MSLKELTWENHKSAERKEFASILMSGSIDPFLYYKYLVNQYYKYLALEPRVPLKELGVEDIARCKHIRSDMKELELTHGFHFEDDLILPSTLEYLQYCERKVPINSVWDEWNEDAEIEHMMTLVPHLYVRHFGDMYGGAMIAKKVPGMGMMYKFKEKDLLKAKVRAILTDDMADEANVCFEFAIKLFGELVNE